MQTPKRLSDYTPPAVEIRAVRLTVTFAEQVEVIGELTLAARPDATPGPYLALDAEDLEFLEVVVDGRTLAPDAYRYDGVHLEIPWPATTLRTRVRLDPERNTRLEGLFPCGGGYFTQCEAEGFRRITPYLDRPDVLAPFEVILNADRQRFPVLLSNGNLVASGIEGERHWAHWVDPYLWLAPTELFMEVGAEVAKGQFFPGSDAGGDRNVGSWAAFAHVGGDVGESNAWRAGVSYLRARPRGREALLTDISDFSELTRFSGDFEDLAGRLRVEVVAEWQSI